MSLRDHLLRIRLAYSEIQDLVKRSFRVSESNPSTSHLTQLEERVMLSATPVAVVDAPEPEAAQEQPENTEACEECPEGEQAGSEDVRTEDEMLSSVDQLEDAMSSLVEDTTETDEQLLEVVLIDSSLTDIETLLDAVDENAIVIQYDGINDTIVDLLAQVEALAENADTQINSLTVLSHGSSGEFDLGGEIVTSEMTAEQRFAWQSLADNFAEDANIYVYGCEVVSENGQGQQLLNLLSELTGTEVYGSNDNTGLGGDWELEAVSVGGEAELSDGVLVPLNYSILATYQDILASSDLVAHWTFDEGSGQSLTDVSGNGNDGTLGSTAGSDSNDPTWTIDGTRGSVLTFDGDEDYITGIGNSPSGSFTVAGWGLTESGGESGYHALYSADTQIWLGVSSATGRIYMYVGGNGDYLQSADNTWTEDTWHHLAGTWDGTTAAVYLDGVELSMTTYGTLNDPIATTGVIGAWSTNTSTEEWEGSIDDLLIFNDALDSDAINNLSNDAPIASDFSLSTNASVAVTTSDVISDSLDPNGDTVSYDSFTQGANGSVIYNNDGTFTYTPDADFNGIDTFTYTVNDGNGNDDTATISVTVSSNAYSILLSTQEDISSGGAPGDDTWSNGEAVELGNPNQDFGSTTDGTFSAAFNLDDFVNDGSAKILAIHHVTQDITIGSSTSIDLQAGDLILSASDDETINGTTFNDDDVFVFRADTLGDYSSGSFFLLMDGSDVFGSGEVRALTLIEEDTTVGGVLYEKGSFLLQINDQNDIIHHTFTSVGSMTAGSSSTFLDVSDLGIGNSEVDALELIETTTTLGGETLLSGELLVSVRQSNTVGTNSLAVTQNDIFILNITTTGSSAVATASMFVDGSDIQLNSDDEDIKSLALVDGTPDAADDAYSTYEATAIITGDVLLNDSDPNNDTLSVSSFTQGSNGTVSYNNDGTFTYTPDANFVGIDTFNYTVQDGDNNVDTATVTITVTGVAPVITSIETADLDGDGYLDAIHITFSEDILDSSVVGNDWDIAGVTGESFSSTTNGDTADDSDIYITFTDGVLDTGALPVVNYTQDSPTDSDLTDLSGLELEDRDVWWDNDWLSRTKITFDNSNSGENLLSFPLLVTLTADDIDFSKILADGADIRFVDNDGNELNYAIDSWDDMNEIATVWVEVQQVDLGSSSDYLYMYYNNTAASDGQNAVDVWPAGIGVWHFDEDPGPGGADEILDSDSTANHGTASSSLTSGDLVTGIIGDAIEFDGSNDYISFDTVDFGDTFTISAWIKPDSTGTNLDTIVANSNSTANVDGFRFFLSEDGQLRFETGNGSASNSATTNDGVIDYDQWNHVAVEVDRVSGLATIYHNGVDVTDDYSIRTDFNTNSDWRVGEMEDGSSGYKGVIDELQIATVDHSADWVEASYLSQNETFNFNLFNAEETYITDNAAPVITAAQSFNVREDASDLDSVGFVATSESNTQSWMITAGNSDGIFAIDSSTGEITIADNTNLNYETTQSYMLSISHSDGINSSAVETVTINIDNVNEAPVINSPGVQSIALNETLTLSTGNGNLISVSDVDIYSDDLEITLSTESGVLSLSGITGLNFTMGNGSNDATMVFTGSLIDVNNALDGLQFIPTTDFNGATTINLLVDDQGYSGLDGAQTAMQAVGISVGPTESLWFSGHHDVSGAGTTGIDSWDTSDVIRLSDPDLAFEAGTSDGTFSHVVDFNDFGSSVDITALHYVTRDITIGSGTTFDLLAGDILFSTADNESFTSTNSLSFDAEDVVVFRPDAVGDPSSGTFYLLLENVMGNGIEGISLVEETVVLPDTTLTEGSFLLTHSGNANNIYLYTVTDAGASTTGSSSLLIDGDDINIDQDIYGLEFVDKEVEIAGETFNAGDILVIVNQAENLGTNSLSVTEHDLVALSVSATTLGSGTAVANASVVLEGDDLNLDDHNEHFNAFTMVIVNQRPEVTATAGTTAYIENATTVIDSGILVTDDGSDLEGATISITGGFDNSEDMLVFTNQNGILGNYNSSTGILTLSGTATVAQYQTALQSIAYHNTSENPSTATRTISFSVDDGDLESEDATRDVSVAAVNDAPVVTAPGSALDVDEQTGLSIEGLGFSVSDVDESDMGATAILTVGEGAITVVAGDSGVMIDMGNGSASVTISGTIAEINSLLNDTSSGTITYFNNSDTPSASTTFSVLVNDNGNVGTDPGDTGDGSSEEDTNSQIINITALNDDPVNSGSLPSDVVVEKDVSSNIDLSAIDLTDVDADTSDLTVTLTTSTGGDLSAAVGTGITIGGTSNALTLTGNLTDLNNYLNTASNITYLHDTPGTFGDNADSIQVNVNDNGYTGDGGGTDIDFGTVNVDIVDTIRPVINSVTLSDSDLTVGETATLTITFSEEVTSFDKTDISLENGMLSSISSGDGGFTWTGTFTPTDDIEDATNVITVNTTLTDLSGNSPLSSESTSNYTIDTQEPTVASITLSDSNLTVGETATLTITFSESVTGFDNSDITVENGMLSTVTSKDGGITWTGTFTPTDNLEDATNNISVGTGVADQAGNALLSGASTSNYAIDTVEPVLVSVTMSDSDLKVGDTSTLTITFSEAVSNFDNSDIIVENGMLSTVTSKDGGITWTGTFTPTDDIEDATNVISVGTSLTDLAGNAPQTGGSTSNYTIDTVEPLITSLSLSDYDLIVGETSLITIEFSESVSGVLMFVDNGSYDLPNSIDGGFTWTALFTPDDNIEDATNEVIVIGTFQDAAGNFAGAAGFSNNYTVDTVEPVITSVTLSDSDLTIGETATLTVTFSEAVTNFSKSDISAENGSLSTLATGDGGITWTGIFTPNANVDDATNVILVDTSLTDLAGNAPLVTASSANYMVDTQQPIVSITRDDMNFSEATSVVFSVDFSEVVNNVDATDFELVLSGLTADPNIIVGDAGDSDPLTYTVTVNDIEGEGTLGLAIAAGTDITDLDNNPLSSSPAVDQSYQLESIAGAVEEPEEPEEPVEEETTEDESDLTLDSDETLQSINELLAEGIQIANVSREDLKRDAQPESNDSAEQLQQGIKKQEEPGSSEDAEELERAATQGNSRAFDSVQGSEFTGSRLSRGSYLNSFDYTQRNYVSFVSANDQQSGLIEEDDLNKSQMALGVETNSVITVLSIGYVIWSIRGGLFLTSFMSVVPTWSFFDPLPILDSELESFNGDGQEESLSDITKTN